MTKIELFGVFALICEIVFFSSHLLVSIFTGRHSFPALAWWLSHSALCRFVKPLNGQLIWRKRCNLEGCDQCLNLWDRITPKYVSEKNHNKNTWWDSWVSCDSTDAAAAVRFWLRPLLNYTICLKNILLSLYLSI